MADPQRAAGNLVAALTGPGSVWAEVDMSDVPTTQVVAWVDEDVLLIAVSGGDACTVLADIAGWQSLADAFPQAKMAAIRTPRPIGCAPHVRAG